LVLVVIVIAVASAPWNYLIDYLFEDFIQAETDDGCSPWHGSNNDRSQRAASTVLEEGVAGPVCNYTTQRSLSNPSVVAPNLPDSPVATASPKWKECAFGTSSWHNAGNSLAERRVAFRKYNIRIAPLSKLNLSKHALKTNPCTPETKLLATWKSQEPEVATALDVNTLLEDIGDQYDDIPMFRDKLDFCKGWR
jgi:hypothetical protein